MSNYRIIVPHNMEKIPVFIPAIDSDTKQHLETAFSVGWLGMGSFTKEFENRISEFLDIKDRYVVATNTGTSALHIGLLASGVGPKDEVITPSFNYVSDHQAIKFTGANVVMCDIQKDNLRVIEDACHAFGTKINGKKIGSYGDITCFSFDPVKIITSIDGGCVIVNNEEELHNLQHFRLLGVDKDTTERYKNKRAWDYDVVSEGYRYHLNNIMASIGISQIKRIDEFIESRRKICQTYNKAFRDIDDLKIPQSDFSNVSPFIYSLRVLNGKREKLIEHLQKLNIDVGIHFVPVHKHTYFSSAHRGDMSVTEKVVKEVVTIPLHSNMKSEFVQRVVDGILSFFNR